MLGAKRDKRLLNLAFNINLRRYILVASAQADTTKVWLCNLKPVLKLEGAWFPHLKLTHDKLLSNCSFKINLRPSTKVRAAAKRALLEAAGFRV